MTIALRLPENDGLLLAVTTLLFLLSVLTVWRWDMSRHTVRLYNWDGRRYRFLGRVRLRKANDMYVINMREGMGETSRTTLYLLAASDALVKRRRYENLLFRAGGSEVWMPVEERMRAEVLFTHRRRLAGRFCTEGGARLGFFRERDDSKKGKG